MADGKRSIAYINCFRKDPPCGYNSSPGWINSGTWRCSQPPYLASQSSSSQIVRRPKVLYSLATVAVCVPLYFTYKNSNHRKIVLHGSGTIGNFLMPKLLNDFFMKEY